MQGLSPRPEGELRVHAVDPGDARVGDELDGAVARHELAQPLECPELDVDAARSEHDVVGVVGARIGDRVVERPPFLVEAAELRLVAGERTVAAACPLPGGLDLDVEEDGEGGVPQGRSHLGDRHRAAAEREHRGLVHVQPRDRVERFANTKLGLSPLREQLGDRTALVPFQLLVEVDEGAAEPGGEPRGRASSCRRP